MFEPHMARNNRTAWNQLPIKHTKAHKNELANTIFAMIAKSNVCLQTQHPSSTTIDVLITGILQVIAATSMQCKKDENLLLKNN